MSNRSDDFNRANGALNGATPSDGGSAWVATSLAAVISNEAGLTATGAGRDVAYLETSASNGTVQCTARVLNASTAISIYGRGNGTADYIVVGIWSGKLEVYRRVAGAYTQLGSTYTGTISAGDVIALSFDSSNNILCKQNGTTRVTTSSSVGATNTQAGWEQFQASSTLRIDDWSWIDAGAAAASLIYFQPAIGPLLVR